MITNAEPALRTVVDVAPLDERRGSARAHSVLAVDLHGLPQRRLTTHDVSRRGLYVITEAPPPLRHAVKLTLHLPDEPISVLAMVVRHVLLPDGSVGGMGVKLFGLGGRARDVWDAFVAGVLSPPRRVARAEVLLAIEVDFYRSMHGHVLEDDDDEPGEIIDIDPSLS